MEKLTADQLTALYSDGKSMKQIADSLGCSVNKIVYWMKKYGVKRRNISDALYLKLNPSGDPFTIKTNLSRSEIVLFGLGIGIYWGEGTKASKHCVRVANTDPSMLKSFIKFLRVICAVDPKKIRYSLVLFNDIDEASAVEYWSRQLSIGNTSFGKIVNIPTQGKGTYKRKSQYGVCTVTVSNMKLKSWIMGQIDEVANARVV